ncbi:MAG TPA: hypothetical protein DIU00_20175 [Phycisphaerales bacterium]|nr:hypothetical protein [Phycisphaerales bacterium]
MSIREKRNNWYCMKKKTFDALAFMRKRREELSRAYTGLSRQQIEEQIQQSLKDSPLWKPCPLQQSSSSAKKVDRHL